MPFNQEMADVVCESQPAVVSFHFGMPSPDLMHRVCSSSAKLISSATTVEEALWLEAHGVDAIIALSVEAGGHRGMFLTDDISTQVGTAYMLCPEVTTYAVDRAALQSDVARTRALTNVFTGRPARDIVNRLMQERGPMNPAAPQVSAGSAGIGTIAGEGGKHGQGRLFAVLGRPER